MNAQPGTIALPSIAQISPHAPTSGPAPLRLLDGTALRGSNVYHPASVFRQRVDLGALAGRRTAEAGSGFAARFVGRFLDLEMLESQCHLSADFLARLHGTAGVPFAEALLEATLAVELSVAFSMRRLEPIDYAGVHAANARNVDLVWQCQSPRLSRRAAQAACVGLDELLPDRLRSRRALPGPRFAVALAALRRHARRRRRSMTSAVIASAARPHVPCEALGDAYLLLGQGAAQHVISIAAPFPVGRPRPVRADKRSVHAALAAAGLPTPEQITAASPDEVLAAARRIGYPVVVKPLNGRRGARVSVDVRNTAGLLSAYNRARRRSPAVLIESFAEGQVYRLLVVGRQVVAALKLTPPRVVGDGRRSVAELVEALNGAAERDDLRLKGIPLDGELEVALRRRGHRLTDILEPGRRLVLTPVASAQLGAAHRDVTDAVHASHKALAVRAAGALDLELAGVDYVTEDITRCHDEVGGSIVDVTDQPDLGPHALPAFGQARDVGRAVLELCFPPGTPAKLPAAVIAGHRGTFRVARELERILLGAGRVVALATRKDVRVGGEPAGETLVRRNDAARELMRDPRVEALVTAITPRRIVRRGLRIEGCTVAAIVESQSGSETEQAMTRQGLDVVARAASALVVVSADSAEARVAVQTVEPRRLMLLARDPHTMLVRRHVAAGGAVLRWSTTEDRILIEREAEGGISVSAPRARSARGEEARTRARVTAVALALGLGLSAEDIEGAMRRRAGLRP